MHLLAILVLATTPSFAQYRHWEDQNMLQVNREAPRAAFFGFGTQAGDRQQRLDGTWKFNWTKTPDERIKDLVNKIIHKQVETAYQEEYLVDTTTRYIPL